MSHQRRAATEADRTWLEDLRRAAYFDLMVETFGSFEEDRHRRHCDECWHQGHIDIVLVDGSPVGMLQLFDDGARIEVGEIQIDPAHQGGGLGSRLLTEVIEHAEASGRELVLSVALKNLRAKALYERLGFRTTGRNDSHHHMQLHRR